MAAVRRRAQRPRQCCQMGDGNAMNRLKYSFAPGQTDLRATVCQCRFGQTEIFGPGLVLDAHADGTIDLNDQASWLSAATTAP